MRTKIGMLPASLSAESRQQMQKFAQRGIKLCSAVPTRGGMLLTYLFDYLCRALIALASAEMRAAHAERALREAREENEALTAQLKLSKAEVPPEYHEDETRVHKTETSENETVEFPRNRAITKVRGSFMRSDKK